MKVGLFGGSFNPVHRGHVEVARAVLEKRLTDEVMVMPCGHHAFDKELTSGEDRVRMIELAVGEIDGVRIDRTEVDSAERNYTIDTLRKLREIYDHDFSLIVGSDILHEIHEWHDYEELMKIVEFIVFKREGYPLKEVEGVRWAFAGDVSSISSTQVRERVKQGIPLGDLVPEGVRNYISERGLYK